MQVKSPIRLDLNNVFRPAMQDGPPNLDFFRNVFQDAHSGIRVLKTTRHLPFAQIPTDTIALTHIQDAAAPYHDVENVIVCGIGGSALGLIALQQALRGTHSNLNSSQRLYVLDNIDPELVASVVASVQGKKNLFVLISKSGETVETLAQYQYLKTKFQFDANNLFIITDPAKGLLRQMAIEQKIPSLPVPNGVGGRFSVLTAVGLFPLAVLGIDVAEILNGAEHMENQCQSEHLEQNPAGLLAVVLHHWIRLGMRQIVLMPYSDRLKYFADWFAQLWGESLGKRHALNHAEVYAGSTPIKSVGVTDQHSLLQLYLDGPRDKVILFLKVDQFQESGALPKNSEKGFEHLSGKTLEELLHCELRATEAALRENQRPNATLSIGKINEFEVGQLCQLLMNVIPYMGIFENINPFDQPAVQRIKDHTLAALRGESNDLLSKRSDLVF